MEKLTYFVIFYIFYLISSINAEEKTIYEIEQNLKNRLFTSYCKTIRPSQTVDLGIFITLFKIIQLDEIKEIMQSSAYLYAFWNEPDLNWNPTDYSNISQIYVPITELWKPDLYIVNSADSSGFVKFTDLTLATLDHKGQVLVKIEYPSKFRIIIHIRCDLN